MGDLHKGATEAAIAERGSVALIVAEGPAALTAMEVVTVLVVMVAEGSRRGQLLQRLQCWRRMAEDRS